MGPGVFRPQDFLLFQERGRDVKAITHSRWLVVMALLGGTFLPLQVGAEETEQQATIRAGEIFGSAAVNSQDLAVSRGGAEVTLNDLKSNGAVHDNQASNLVTGSNFVTDGSFAGAPASLRWCRTLATTS